MRFSVPDPIIGDREGFTPENDLFGYAEFGGGLAKLLAGIEDPLVIALDGAWGTGKSIFLKTWASHLRSQNFPVILFDAFANDYIEDAFSALASEIFAFSQNNSNKTISKDVLEKSLGVGKVLLRAGLKIGVKAATLGVINGESIEDLAKDISNEVSELEDAYLGEIITKKRERDHSIEQFKLVLSELSYKSRAEEAQLPLVIIIDELDRCRPTFALQLLERVKHIFSVPNVHFVLGVNLYQLHQSISSAYGNNIDAEAYLNKFIHATYVLGKRVRHQSESTNQRFVDYLGKSLEISQENTEAWRYASEYLVEVSNRKRLSLRSIQRAASAVSLALVFSEVTNFRPIPLLTGLAIMKAIDPTLFGKAKRGNLELKEASSFLGFSAQYNEGEFRSDYWWIYALSSDPDESLIKAFRSEMFRYNISRETIIPIIAEYIVDGLPKS